jgi:phosphotransferase system  glucose/maltose/N-acetylglucosamine-specific IIC component
MRAERAKAKSCKDDGIIAQGKRSAALGYGCKRMGGWFFTQGGGLGGLALGYYLAAPSGRRKGEHLGAGDAGLRIL